MSSEIELEPGYYLDNFFKLTRFVEGIYSDILSEREADFLSRFKALSRPAQMLYVRLISRKGPLFRLDKLNYPEIPSLEKAARELHGPGRGSEAMGFLSMNEDWTCEELLPLFTKPELATLFSHLEGVKSSLKRDVLVRQLLESSSEIACILTNGPDIISPLGLEEMQTFSMLFFGNLYQDLSEFVITDLAVVRYEDYSIDRNKRLFPDRASLEMALAYHRMAEEYYEERDIPWTGEEIIERADRLPEPGNIYFLKRRRDRLLNDMARQLERLDRAEKALAYYALSEHPPARERRARIHLAREEYSQCRMILNEILISPMNEEEREFALFFQRKTDRKEGIKTPLPAPCRFEEISIICPRTEGYSVEQSALSYFMKQGYGGYNRENIPWNALFGLAFWDIIFHPLPGVFYNPFQRGPADLHHPVFFTRRKELFTRRFEELADKETGRKLILERYDTSQGISNAFVNWKNIDREMIENLLDLVPREHLLALFERISRDVRGNRSGFPDLVLFPPAELNSPYPYLMAEVKGPGDKLQKNQKRWISLYEEKGIPFVLVLLAWEEEERG